MAIIKLYDKVENLGQHDGVVVLVKVADYENTSNEVSKVITAICIKDLEGNIVYKNSCYPFICYLDNSKYFNLMDIISDITLYVDKCNLEPYWKNQIIDNFLNNKAVGGSIAVKNFKKEYYQEIEAEIKREQQKEYNKQAEQIKDEIIETVEAINKYKEMRYIKPNKFNDYTLQLMTRDTLKEYKYILAWRGSEVVTKHKEILDHLKEYLYYLTIDYCPKEFMQFDKVI